MKEPSREGSPEAEARFQPRLQLLLPKVQTKKQETSSLDQLQVSAICLSSAKPPVMPYSEDETRSKTQPKLPKPLRPLRQESPRKLTAPTLPSLKLLKFIKKILEVRSSLFSLDETEKEAAESRKR